MGKEKEQARHELRQAVQEHPTVLQEGNYEENREESEARLPVLPPVLFINTTYKYSLVYK